MGIGKKSANRRWKAALPLMAAGFLIFGLFFLQKAGMPNESLVQDSDAIYMFAAGEQAASGEQFERLRNIVDSQSALHGHEWLSETVEEASFPSDAPWKRLIGRIPAPEQTVDEKHEVLLARLKGILKVVATGCGSAPSDFEIHITAGRGISAYSMADGSIYFSYMLAASGEDEIAFALAHEIRHLRACHYKIEGGYTWELEEVHAMAFSDLAGRGFGSLIEPSGDYYSQESECDAYGAFMAAFCGFDPSAALRLIARLPEGDGKLYPSTKKRLSDIEKLLGILNEEGFLKNHLPAMLLRKGVISALTESGTAPLEETAYLTLSRSVGREGAALDLMMRPSTGTGEEESTEIAMSGIFETGMEVRIEARARHAITFDVAISIASHSISGISVSIITSKALMIEQEGGWRLSSAFDTPGRRASWTLWQFAEDEIPYYTTPDSIEAESAFGALSAWKTSFTMDPAIHALCYSQSGVQPYFENGSEAAGIIDLLALSDLFSSVEAGSEMRLFDITASKLGRGFISVGFSYSLLAGGLPVVVGNARLGMVPERGGWAVAGVSLF